MEVTAALSAKAGRAASFAGVASLLESGVIRLPRLDGQPQKLTNGQRMATPKEIRILRSKGNAAIRMNDLFLCSINEQRMIRAKWPHLERWTRTIDYPKTLWWSDSDQPVQARTAGVRENWNAARSLALMASRLDGTTKEEERNEFLEAEDGDDTAVVTRNQREREEMIALMEEGRVTSGEDYWTDTEYPVLESQASFAARGSNDDLDELFGEEPKDQRGVAINRLEKSRQWRGSSVEEYFNETRGIMPSGDAFAELFGEDHPFAEPLETDAITNKPTKGQFVEAADFFEARDRLLLSGLQSDYTASDMSTDLRPLKAQEIAERGFRKSYRGWELPGPGAMDTTVLTTARPHLNPAAPTRPHLKKGQKWVVVNSA